MSFLGELDVPATPVETSSAAIASVTGGGAPSPAVAPLTPPPASDCISFTPLPAAPGSPIVTEEEHLAAGRHERWLKSQPLAAPVAEAPLVASDAAAPVGGGSDSGEHRDPFQLVMEAAAQSQRQASENALALARRERELAKERRRLQYQIHNDNKTGCGIVIERVVNICLHRSG